MFSGCQKHVIIIFYFEFYKFFTLYCRFRNMNTWPLEPVCRHWPTHLNKWRTDRTWILWRRMIYYDLFNLYEISNKSMRTDSPFDVSCSSMMSTSSSYYNNIKNSAFNLNVFIIWKFTYLFAISMNDWNYKFFILKWRMKFLD